MTFAGAWSLAYPAAPSETVYGIAVTYVADSTARVVPAANVNGPFMVTGSMGGIGLTGEAGGGAFELLGEFSITGTSSNDDIWHAMGFNWDTSRKFAMVLINGYGGLIDAEAIYDPVRGVTAAVAGAAGTAATRRRIIELVSGFVYMGHTAAGEAVLEFSGSAGAMDIEVYAYVPGDVTTTQGERGAPGTQNTASGTDPDDADGVDGDQHWNTVTTSFFLKVAGSWVLQFTVAGAPSPFDFYAGSSDDDTPLGSELTIAASNGLAVLPGYVGAKHHLIARLASEDAITSIVYSDDSSQANVLEDFTEFATTVVPTGETEAFTVWVSDLALNNGAGTIIKVR